MALAVTDFSNFGQFPLGNGKYLVFAKYTGPASYASGGEVLTVAKCRSAFGGISNLSFLQCTSAFPASGGASSTLVEFEPINDGTNTGKFHFYNSGEAHTHDIKAIGGLTSSEALFLDGSQSFGKTAATNRTVVGSTSATTGGVVSTAAMTSSTEVASTTALNTLSCWVFGLGTE